MRKLFLLIPLLAFAMITKAADQYPNPSVSNSLYDAVVAVGDGETIWLDDAVPYDNVKDRDGEGHGDDYTKLRGGKHITIRAIAGKHPVIKYEVPFLVREAVNAKFIGVKFDGTNLTLYDYYFQFYDDADNSLEFEDCEFTNISKYMVYVPTGKKAASCVFKNCNIHGNTQRIFYNYKATVNRLEFNNTEISNCSHYIIHNNQAQMDSCIIVNSNIHNNSSRFVLNEGTIDGLKLNGSVFTYFPSYSIVDNYTNGIIGSIKCDGCEFANNSKTVINGEAASHAGECLINNCYFHDNVGCAVYFRKSSVASQQTCSDLRVTNSTFTNIDVSADYYSVIDIRPDVTTMTDAIKVIVDHCTFYNLTTINHDYSAIRPYKLSDVTISNCIFAHPTAEVDVNEGPQNARRATCCYGGTISNCLTWNLMEDASRNAHRQDGGQPVLSGNFTANPLFTDADNKDFTFPGNWATGSVSPARGTATDNSDLGDPRWYTAETLPTTNLASAYDLYGAKALLLGNIALDGTKIQYSGSGTPGTAKWKLHIEKACALGALVDRTAGNESGCKLTLTAYDADGNEVDAAAATSASYSEDDFTLPGNIYIPEAGDYALVLTNSTNNSGSLLEKITLSYMGGAVQALSTSADTPMPLDEAWFTGCSRDADGITFTGHNTDWIKWNISTSETKFYDLTLNVNASNAHGLTVAIYEDENAAPVASLTEGSFIETTGTLALELGRISLSGGKNFVVKVTNAPSGSVPEITSLVFAPFIPSTVNLPNTLDFANSVLSARAHLTDGKLYFAPIGDTNPAGEWARWSVATNHDGLYLFTMGVNSDNAQSYKITILDDGDNEVAFCDLKTNSGAQTLKHYFQLATGNYSVKVENTYAWSHGHLTSLVVTEPNTAITMSEEATDNSAWSAKVNDGNNYDVQIIRTLRAGMYNTFCLPFEVTPNEAKEIFGLDIEIYTLETAVVTDNVLYVTLDPASDIYPGTPVFIKPSHDIVNPIFDDVTFTAAAPSATTKTNADFEGTFVKSSLEPNQNILYLGTDNTLYYPAEPTPIKGMRGWFVIHDTSSPAPAIRQMRIVEKTDTTTDITTVEESDNKAIKTITNGQLIIIRDGVRYNAMGIRIE